MIARAPAAAILLLAIAAACAPMWWIFGTLQLLVAIAVAMLVGAGIAWLGAVRRWSALTLILVGAGALALLAVPLAAPQRIPRGEWLPALGDAAAAVVLSWRRLLTVELPVGGDDSLLMAPVLLVLVGSLVGVSLVLRTRRAELAALVPAAIGVWGILWGPAEVPAPWLTGLAALVPIAGFVTVVRQARRRSRAPRQLSSLARRVGAGLLVAAVAAGAAGAAGALVALPERTVLRGDATAELSIEGASPLSEHRWFWQQGQRDAVQLTATGLEAGDRIRLAALDRYDGEVAGVATASFERVTSAAQGTGRVVGVTVHDLATPWLPVVGEASAIRFVGERSAPLAAGLFRDDELDALVVEPGLGEADGYQMLVEQGAPLVAGDALADLEPAAPEQTAPTLPEPMLEALTAWTGEAATPGARLAATVEGMRATGYVSHGVLDDEPPSRPGHSLDRLEALFEEPMIGDAEQYATAGMLLARQLGFDARIVVGFVPEVVEGAPTDVVGSDAAAWIEVRTTTGWVGIDVLPDPRPIPETDDGAPAVLEEPPVRQAPAPAPDGQPEGADAAAPDAPDQPHGDDALVRVLLSIAAVLGLVSLIAALPVGLVLVKALRRRRRRGADDPRAQAEGAWDEAVDGLRDRGIELDRSATRVEQAGDDAALRSLADDVDAAVFAASPPDDAAVEAAWTRSDAVLAAHDEQAGAGRRALASLNPVSLTRR